MVGRRLFGDVDRTEKHVLPLEKSGKNFKSLTARRVIWQNPFQTQK